MDGTTHSNTHVVLWLVLVCGLKAQHEFRSTNGTENVTNGNANANIKHIKTSMSCQCQIYSLRKKKRQVNRVNAKFINFSFSFTSVFSNII